MVSFPDSYPKEVKTTASIFTTGSVIHYTVNGWHEKNSSLSPWYIFLDFYIGHTVGPGAAANNGKVKACTVYFKHVMFGVIGGDIYINPWLCRHVQQASLEWLQAKHATNQLLGKVELLFRPFLRWLDRSLERLFTEGARQVRLQSARTEDCELRFPFWIYRNNL